MKKSHKKRSTLFFILLISLSLFSQDFQQIKGKDFWLTFSWDSLSNEAVLYIDIQTFEDSASIIISAPHLNWEKTRNLSPWKVNTIEVPSDLVNNSIFGEAEKTGIHVVSNSDIGVRAWYRSIFNSDATEILPTQFLGTDYRMVTHHGVLNGFGSSGMIVATENNTQVEIKSSVLLEGFDAIEPIILTELNAGETYQLVAQDYEDDLSGTQITACKPIAVFGESSSTAIFTEPIWKCCNDRIWTQLHPETAWTNDTFYVFPYYYPFNKEPFYALKITAKESNTHVAINGEPIYTLNRGDIEYLNHQSKELVITSDKPISIHKLMYNGLFIMDTLNLPAGDPAMLPILPSSAMINKATYRAYSASDLFPENYIDVFMQTSTINTFKLNGLPVNAQINSFSPDDEYSWFTLFIEPYETYILSSSEGFFAYAYGMDRADSYSLNLGYKLPVYPQVVPEIIAQDTVCINESVLFTYVGIPQLEDTFAKWDFGVNEKSNFHNPNHSFSEPGTYEVKLEIQTNNCFEYELSKIITVLGTPTPNFEIQGIEIVNSLDTFVYFIPKIEGSKYEWNIHNGSILHDNGSDSIFVKWEDRSFTHIEVVETTLEGCIGGRDTLFANQIELENCIADFLLAPNPVENQLQLSFIAEYLGNSRVLIFNMAGQLMVEDFSSTKEGFNEHFIDVASLASGLYILRFEGKNCIEESKFIKMK